MELEIKYFPVCEADFLKAAEALKAGEISEKHMSAEYFDTDDFDLSKEKMTLRRRIEGDRTVCAVKSPVKSKDGVFFRKETEVESENIADALKAFASESGENAAAAERIFTENLKVKVKMEFLRKYAEVREGDTLLELSFDEGYMEKDGKRGPVSEMEIELKSGSVEDFEKAVKRLEELALPLGKDSKYKRAMAL